MIFLESLTALIFICQCYNLYSIFSNLKLALTPANVTVGFIEFFIASVTTGLLLFLIDKAIKTAEFFLALLYSLLSLRTIPKFIVFAEIN